MAVTAELRYLGFYTEAVRSVHVFLVPSGRSYGFQWYGGDGNIYIPAVSRSFLRDVAKGKRTTIRDVLRHEFAHVVADKHRGLIRSRRFSEAFGAGHSWDFEWVYDPELHVSKYAATAPAEDFAETFMFYLRHRGQLPESFDTPALRRKWRFITDLSVRMRRGDRTW